MEARKILKLPAGKKNLIYIGVLVLLIAFFATLIFISASRKEDGTVQTKWPSGERMEGVAEVSGTIYSVKISQESTAVFVKDFSEKDADEYVRELKDSGISFFTADFPLVAHLDEDRLLTLAYSAGEKMLSITVTDKTKE